MTRLLQSADSPLQWDCGECRKLGLDVERGCRPGTKAAAPIVTSIGARFDRCPKASVREEWAELLELYTDYAWLKKYGVLPEPGGKLQQSPRFIAAADIIGSEISKMEAEQWQQAKQRTS